MTPLAFSAPDASLFRALIQARYLIRRPTRKRLSAAKTHLNPSHRNSEGKTSAVYAPLPDANSYIRLLRIQSVEATPSEATQIRCVLEIFAIEQAPPYNAISYTWGPPTPTQSIYVDGQPREVRENCKAVLLQAYGWGPGEYYWIDAICINQSNLEEKGSQVALMGDLFGKAKIVLACVGEHADDSELLYAMLERSAGICGRMGSVEDKYLVPGPLVFEFILWAVWNETETTLKMYRALKAFLGRPYFTRVWVYQELFLARNVTIFCGKSYLPIKLFLGLSTGAFWLWFSEAQDGLKAWIIRRTGRLGLAKAHTHHRLENPFLKAGSFTQNRLRFDELIRHVSDLSCEDPRDMVYAIRSIADWKDKVPIQPDYSRDRFDLALDFMEHLERGGFSGNFPSFVNVTQYLELHTDPPPGLEEAVRRRMIPRPPYGRHRAKMRL
ncbi:HETdomain-containing protein [Colletotrichum plurivorum]|uniref:HETdomain-containing protein n=1 Tax=Colletotrichum plurivorum TaxID=2175906 RepID=A0A8H6N6U6_9PEZI|nr:HETdomain-containing protein [Colletotrichum plurivorum]